MTEDSSDDTTDSWAVCSCTHAGSATRRDGEISLSEDGVLHRLCVLFGGDCRARDVFRQPNVGSLCQTRFRQQQGTRCLQTQWTVWRANLILFLADLADFFSDRQLVDRRQAEAKEQNDATF